MKTKTPNFRVRNEGQGSVTLEIYDGIGPEYWGLIGVKTISKALKDAGDVNEIIVRINSPGGDMWEGHAIYNVLKSHKAKVLVKVDGCAASSGSLIAMAGDDVEIPKNALLMLHDPWTYAIGDANEMRKQAEVLDKHRDTAVETYHAKSGKPKEQITKWMADETWMTGEEAVAAGLADRTSPALQVNNSAQVADGVLPEGRPKFRKTPDNLAALLAPSLSVPPPEAKKDPPMKTQAELDAEAAAAKLKTDGEGAAKEQAAKDAAAAASTAAVTAAVDAERKRASDISAACKQAGKPEMAAKFIEDKSPVADVQKALFDALCKERAPSDAGEGGVGQNADPDAAYKKEYAAQKEAYVNAGISEEQFVKQRRVDDGKEELAPAKK